MAVGQDRGTGRQTDLRTKGLAGGSVGLLASVVLGISSIAPVYALTATLGPTVTEVGLQMPAVFLAGFLPMLLVAYAYRELNRVAPDCGTSFTWTTKAFNPYVGWLCGWGALLATVIVLSNLAGVAVSFFYLLLGEITGSESLATLGDDAVVNALTCVAFVALATWVTYRGVEATKRVQYVLVGFQMAVLLVFAVLALAKAGSAPRGIAFEFSWLDPTAITSFSAFTAGLSLSLFIYWGWDTCLTVNEETAGSARTPGRAALLTMLVIIVTYVGVAIVVQMYAGVGTEGTGLGNPDTSDNVFAALAGPVLGPGLAFLLFLAVVASSASSLQTTFLPTTRTMLAMGTYGALPQRLAEVHPRHRVPSTATLVAGAATAAFYVGMTIISENVLIDTIYALGLMICFYYGLTAYACVWYFRRELFRSPRDLVFKGVLPLLGALMLTAVFVQTAVDTLDPAYGSGSSVFGIGSVFVIGIGLLLLGVVLMFAWRARHPDFFRGRTLRVDTPSLVFDE
ncbi:amino acid/polyamine/organocation transporter, APC superfamily [Geodermatophilus dictyosporus]|uniref:Amino acid/polyamine/organocation transporter, APC superfamily n=1 Tax=Geodermatophilus dictyosporus TaxID=1523247 RepID=A0A1I5T6S7_9ACTN|nr:APC family permease [Geodermatophilus dictyosporus]SFP78764.1 amino acid/polyamine/organocation transporter, APC superfamily [Geodermatophilus dictyosporus]